MKIAVKFRGCRTALRCIMEPTAMTGSLTYRDAGVDIDAGDTLVERIKPFARATRRAEVLADVGGFSGLMRLPSGLKDPVLVSGTDGVGTKLKIAFLTGRHDTIGEDLVAMSVNDIVTCGAEPLFFLDYFATSKLDVPVAESVIRGIATGCTKAGCALLGGETAEMPGLYAPGEYDLAGFCVGVVERDKILDGRSVSAGDVVIGVHSSGLHSNGYSLVRRVLIDDAKLPLDRVPDGCDASLADLLLAPTRIYARAARAAVATEHVKAMSHITGGGLPGNVPRVLPDGLGVQLDSRAWPCPPVFALIAALGNVARAEMRRAFNMGVGLVVIATSAHADEVIAALTAAGERAGVIGSVVETPADTEFEARVAFAD